MSFKNDLCLYLNVFKANVYTFEMEITLRALKLYSLKAFP